MSHDERLSVQQVDEAAYKPMYQMEKYIHSGVLDEGLLGIVKIRASQINGCAFCLDMHAREARSAGIDQRKLDVLAGWREAPDLYTERERAALALTESVTLIGQDGVPDDVWRTASSTFDDQELVTALMAISAINVWNRLAIATRQSLPDA
ncbi:carboxymuconolactone decarboxylase family protein [Spelaeicoccus albus]|uniref:AhpD family alkylhydroperoxidase n=1 Tax=Spelaeicoccus albus TaxID=1280376 RepID=A0A7Z0D4E8_9MICO|nr:carboxymuconolactone decarboxylase family protein [Spelaeicoccus albus]NYI68702.1 AhpD family alkylhydroperoxidase [Spelaeicoccus albus]